MKLKSVLIATTLISGVALSAASAKTQEEPIEPCQYTVMQNMIRDARSHEPIFRLIESGVLIDDPDITCGGSLLQLAIRRGNPNILNGMLVQKPDRVREEVSLKGFEIAGAPNKIPVVLFAAYYAPSESVFRVMLDRKAPVAVRDSKGHDILWYLDQNPVLRRTDLTDQVRDLLQNETVQKRRAESREELDAIAKERLADESQTVTIKPGEESLKQLLEEPDLSADTLAMPNP